MSKKKFIILSTIFLVGINGYGQKKKAFIPGVKLQENTIVSEVYFKDSILFVFKGHTHLINFYLDLSESLKKQFIKSENKVDFNFDLFSNKPFESDLKSIPKEKIDKTNYNIICVISTSNFKSWDSHLIQKRKQNYNLNIVLKKSKKDELIKTAIINVNSYYTITTQNNNSSLLIYDIITK
jgi:hypothetical protein